MNYYTYITTNPAKTVFYTGVTNNLKRRMKEHRNEKGTKKHFAEKYYCHKLIYYETFERILEAIHREKEIKNISRKAKIELIKSQNPEMAFYLIW